MTTVQHTARSLADALDARLEGPSELVCTGVSSIAEAEEGDITFMVNSKYAALWKQSKATIGIVQKSIEVPHHTPSTRALIYVEDADLAIAYVLSLFHPVQDFPEEGIHNTAIVSSTAKVGKGVRIGPYVVIAENAVVGDHVSLYSHVRIGRDCVIGRDTTLRAGVVIEYGCKVGNECILHANVTIGADGFGYRANADKTALVKLPHIGNVEIGNVVEIGSNSCIDRGKFSSTIIGNGTKIDNLVQIGHNCKIGDNCAISATTAIAGSVQVGNWVQIGGDVGIAPHCVIGDGAKIGAKSGVMRDVPAGEECLGLPASPLREALRQWASTRKLPGIIAQLGQDTDE